MDDKLKEAIAAVRTGNKREAQQHLTALLDEDPQQVQGWYLLSLLVDSPQKQAAYLSKTLALNPNHEKAKAQLALLKASEVIPSVSDDASNNFLRQAESDEVPDWLAESDPSYPAKVNVVAEETAVTPPEDLPDWLREPAHVVTHPADEEPTPQKTELSSDATKTAVSIKQPSADSPSAKQKKATSNKRRTGQDTRSLNIALGALVVIALVVLVVLAYLLLA